MIGETQGVASGIHQCDEKIGHIYNRTKTAMNGRIALQFSDCCIIRGNGCLLADDYDRYNNSIHLQGGSAEVARKFYFLTKKIATGKFYSDLVLPTTKFENLSGLPGFSYKLRERVVFDLPFIQDKT